MYYYNIEMNNFDNWKMKKLRNYAHKLLTLNQKRVDGRSISKFQKDIQGHRPKVLAVIKTLLTDEVKVKSPLDEGINEGKKKRRSRYLTKKDVKANIIKKEKKEKYYYSGMVVIEHLNSKVYYDSKTGEKKTKHFVHEHSFYVSVSLSDSERKDEKKVEEALKREIMLTADFTEFDSSDTARVKYVFDVTDVPKREMDENYVSPKGHRMRNATYATLDIKGLRDYKFTPFRCVYGALKHRYGFDEDYLLQVFRDAEAQGAVDGVTGKQLEFDDGVSTSHVLYLAKKKDFSMYAMDQNERVFEKYISKNNNRRALVYVKHNEHMYLVEDDKQISHITHVNARREKNTNISSLFKEYENKNTFHLPIYEDIEVSELKNYTKCNIMYSARNIYNILSEIYLTYNYEVSSKNIKLSGYDVKYIRLELFDLHLYADVNYDEVHHVDYKKVMDICKKVNIQFNNQPISSVMLEYEKTYFKLKSQRVEITADEKKMVLDMNEDKCQMCGTVNKKGSYHFDHIMPLAAGGSNKIDNLQVLCRECHFTKTHEEQQNSDYVYINPAESSYNKETRQIFASDLAKSWAFIEVLNDAKPKKGDKRRNMDMVKCRRNILMNNKMPLPVYTVMDKVEVFKETDAIVCGMYYIEVYNDIYNHYLPLRGNGWYMYNTINYCLDNGMLNVCNIKYKLIPSLTIKKNHYTAFLSTVVDTFGDMAKVGVNAFIGCFNKKDSTSMKLSLASSKADAQHTFLHTPDSFVKYDKHAKIWATYTKHHMTFDETRAPIYKFIVEQEAIEIDILMTAIKKAGGKVAYVNTDNVTAYFKSTDAIDKVVSNTYWDDKKKVLKYGYEKDKVQRERMKQKIRREVYRHTEKVWREETDNNDDDFAPLAKMMIDSKKSWYIGGGAGTGKSHLTRNIMKQVKNYVALAPTNKAAMVIDGTTIHRFLACVFLSKAALLGRLKGVEYIIIDEVSMVKEVFYKVFLMIKRTLPNINFILVGDYNQLDPVADRVEECDYRNSPALYELADGNRLMLLKCRRAERPIQFEEVDKIDKKAFGNKMTSRHICFTNKKRIELNSIMMKQYKQEMAMKKKRASGPVVKKLGYDKNSQDVELLVGMPCIARINNINVGIANNAAFIIKYVDDDRLTMEGVEGEKKRVNIETEDFNKYFHLAFAITAHKSQGQTMNYPHTLHEYDRFNSKMRYVALTRTTKREYINIL